MKTIDFECPRCGALPGQPCVWGARTNPHNQSDYHLSRADEFIRWSWKNRDEAGAR